MPEPTEWSSDITPPPELIKQWYMGAIGPDYEGEIARRAAQWGADQELEACVKLLELSDDNARDFLYSARRPKPKPPSLKEQAIAVLEDAQLDAAHCNILRRALEQLDD